ncbi:MAG: hypothetical protein HC843_03605 [Sphingomonadales bacterium]|nr:hypothetical protein [Sphingomonadales bacterium]
MKDIDHAYYFLNKRDYRNANQKFSEISAETLLETPNDAAWAGHAESLCKSGNQKIGLEKLENAQCSVDLLSRKRSCEDLDQSKDSAGFPSECYAQYCEAEIIRPNFERHSDLADLGKEWTEKYRNYGVYLQKIRAVCNGS